MLHRPEALLDAECRHEAQGLGGTLLQLDEPSQGGQHLPQALAVLGTRLIDEPLRFFQAAVRKLSALTRFVHEAVEALEKVVNRVEGKVRKFGFIAYASLPQPAAGP